MFRTWIPALALVAAGLAATVQACAAERIALYDVNFNSPGDVLGDQSDLAPLEFPYPFPTRIYGGAPRLLPSLCGLDDQPLELQPLEPRDHFYEGVQFQLPYNYAKYHVALDLCIDQLRGFRGYPKRPFAILFDTPESHPILFLMSGDIAILTKEDGSVFRSDPMVIGSYTTGTPLRLSIDIDAANQRWKIAATDAVIHDGPIDVSGMETMRIVIRGLGNRAAVDNIMIEVERELLGEPGPRFMSAPGIPPLHLQRPE